MDNELVMIHNLPYIAKRNTDCYCGDPYRFSPVGHNEYPYESSDGQWYASIMDLIRKPTELEYILYG